MALAAWLRVIRVRFLLASVIAATVGVAVGLRHEAMASAPDLMLLYGGVMALHASVDLLNDHRDFVRGIDSHATRTKMSGGTGVLPEGLLDPKSVYRAGIAFLAIGAAIGAYFAVTDGPVIAMILGFAVISILLYSTRIVDSGLGELFVAIKGCMIVLGASYVQSGQLGPDAALAGIAVGSLSSMVLFVASFPDRDADRSGGRKTLVIMLGPARAANLYWAFAAASYVPIALGAAAGLLPTMSLACLGTIPLAVLAAMGLQKHHSSKDRIIQQMSRTLLCSRITGAILAASILAASMLAGPVP